MPGFPNDFFQCILLWNEILRENAHGLG